MGKLRIGTATPIGMGAITKVYVGMTQVWPEQAQGGVTNQPISDELVTTGVGGPVSAGVTFKRDGSVIGVHSGGAVIANWYLPNAPTIGDGYKVVINGTGTGNGVTTFPPSGVPFDLNADVALVANGTGGARTSIISWSGTYTILNTASQVVGTGSLNFSMEISE